MSVNSISTTQQIQSLQSYRPPPLGFFQDAGTTSSTASSSPGSSQGSGGTSPFAKLAQDLQAALVSLQSSRTGAAAATTPVAATATSTGTGTSIGTGTSTGAGSGASGSSTDPLTTLQNDLQSLVSQLQGGPGSSQGAGGAPGHHHHHPDSDGDGQAAGAGSTGTTGAGSTGSTTAAATASTASPPPGIAGFLQAFQATMGGGSTSVSSISSGLSLAA